MKRLLAGLGVVITAFLGFFLAGRKSGKDSVRADNAEAGIKHARRANEIDSEVRSLSDDALNRELRKH